jgi:hypothetical protein
VFRVFRDLKSPQPFGFRFPPFGFRLPVSGRVFRGQNLLQFHFWSSQVTFGHVWSSLAKIAAHVLRLLRLFAAMNSDPPNPWLKRKLVKKR